MDITVTVKPSLLNNIQSTSTLQIVVDCSSILQLLKQYDLLIKISLKVATTEILNSNLGLYYYEFSQIFKNVQDNHVTLEAVVYGNPKDIQIIQNKTQGIFIKKSR